MFETHSNSNFFFQEETIHCDLLGLFVNIWYNTIEHQCNTIANSLASHYTHKCLVCSALILLSEEKISDLRVNKACHKTDGGCSSSTALPRLYSVLGSLTETKWLLHPAELKKLMMWPVAWVVSYSLKMEFCTLMGPFSEYFSPLSWCTNISSLGWLAMYKTLEVEDF